MAVYVMYDDGEGEWLPNETDKDRKSSFIYFKARPRVGDMIKIDKVYYAVSVVELEGYRHTATPSVYTETGRLFVKCIGRYEVYRKLIIGKSR